ncbi:DNA-binding response OmpR family regulator [Mucilaginibacter frigoritolerans]|uniref:DNA-binding response OmpR family regulator n=1 Tax=Mucilaginibacter frigoritolerans TaxID=652788 RepID=A0A562TQZ0_9SPHI|nr:response regulator transcription factor [Mucilaginibacter frigoritolerans]TWI95614.1 DNA-binding response OmpR family regulator [Mucilaginibacter frigoritolerans]
MKTKLLLVEDDYDLGFHLKEYLEMNGFIVHQVFNGEEARAAIKRDLYDVLVVDIMMPKEDGFTLIEKLKPSYPQIPFLFLTARTLKGDIIQGLRLGADDYIHKPFDPDELILRIENILRRTNLQRKSDFEIIEIGLYRFEIKNQRLISPTFEKTLTEKEADLLLYLFERQNQLIKRNDILVHLWKEPDFFSGRSMDVFVTRLRKLLSEDSKIQIESIRGLGIRFSC